MFVVIGGKKIPKLRQERHVLPVANTYTQIYIRLFIWLVLILQTCRS